MMTLAKLIIDIIFSIF